MINDMQLRILSEPRKTDERAVMDCVILLDSSFKMKFIQNLLQTAEPKNICYRYRNAVESFIHHLMAETDLYKSAYKNGTI